VKAKHVKTLKAIYTRPTPAGINWRKVEGLIIELKGSIEEREGSRVLVRLAGERRVIHKPHPRPTLSLAQAESIRKWFEHLGIKP
jgi:hypothetical protein